MLKKLRAIDKPAFSLRSRISGSVSTAICEDKRSLSKCQTNNFLFGRLPSLSAVVLKPREMNAKALELRICLSAWEILLLRHPISFAIVLFLRNQ